jgi:hypothetical protein
MDPFTALSLAGTIVQFVKFGSKLLSTTQELYRSTVGSLDVNQTLELVTADLHSLIAKSKQSFRVTNEVRPLTKEEQAGQETFHAICAEATKIAGELIRRLEKLKVKNAKHRKWESLLLAVKSAWSKEEVDSLNQRLASLKKSLESRVIFSLR